MFVFCCRFKYVISIKIMCLLHFSQDKLINFFVNVFKNVLYANKRKSLVSRSNFAGTYLSKKEWSLQKYTFFAIFSAKLIHRCSCSNDVFKELLIPVIFEVSSIIGSFDKKCRRTFWNDTFSSFSEEGDDVEDTCQTFETTLIRHHFWFLLVKFTSSLRIDTYRIMYSWYATLLRYTYQRNDDFGK